MNPLKTYKRELALAMLAYYFVSLTAGAWYPEAAAVAEASKIMIFTFAAGAFALDAGAKQLSK